MCDISQCCFRPPWPPLLQLAIGNNQNFGFNNHHNLGFDAKFGARRYVYKKKPIFGLVVRENFSVVK